jgi:uncharacterized protein (TIGR03083 family)
VTTATGRELPGEVAGQLSDLADLLAALEAKDWDAPSLCPGWRIREVVAHLTMPARWSRPAVLAGLARSGFRWHSFADRAARRDARLPTSDLVAALRSDRLAAWRPPGGGVQGALVHAVIHSLDVTVPLGIDQQTPPERLRVVLDALVTPASLKHFGVETAAIELRASDVNWTHGSGRVVDADAQTLALALSGRRQLPG